MQISGVTLDNYINQPNGVELARKRCKMNGQWATFSVACGQGKRGKRLGLRNPLKKGNEYGQNYVMNYGGAHKEGF